MNFLRPFILHPFTRFRSANLALIAFCLASLILLAFSQHKAILRIPALVHNDFARLPPLYPEYDEEERKLPQHNEDAPFPDGRHARFIRFDNQIWGLGLNNQLFEILLNSEIARRAERSYAFTPYVWKRGAWGEYIDVEENNHLVGSSAKVRAARVPLRAIIQSPTSGEPWPTLADEPSTSPPRAVSERWYEHMCPRYKRLVINPEETNKEIGVDFERDDTLVILDKWAEYLRNLDHPCVHIKYNTPRIIDFRTMGSPTLESLWPSFSTSPVMTAFAWSPLVHNAVERNLDSLHLRSGDSPPHDPPSSSVPGLVTLHVRRQDFKDRTSFSRFAPFHGWSHLSFLPDRIDVAPGTSEDDRLAYAFPRCWVERSTIVERLRLLRTEYADNLAGKTIHLNKVHLATNGDAEWVEEVRRTLLDDGWESVTSTYDLMLGWEERGVPVDDMEFASRGEVFVGNGFSTFTSTVVLLRLSSGLPLNQTWFWRRIGGSSRGIAA
ncbi:hypothetical protein DL93DRAFT_2067052 [Clavulina sp. PMI_390]|nr:hypothetical protein DL93DRAFT_2067052 [Clavulina sp. PMI_390]